jgi:hypothetical protein
MHWNPVSSLSRGVERRDCNYLQTFPQVPRKCGMIHPSCSPRRLGGAPRGKKQAKRYFLKQAYVNKIVRAKAYTAPQKGDVQKDMVEPQDLKVVART